MMTSMTEFASIPTHHLVVVSAGLALPPPQSHGQAHPPASKQPTEGGNICRDTYTGAGAVLGAAITSETGGWGALPGTVLGGVLGRAVCSP